NFLDVGCGCGRLARFLIESPTKFYSGFDRHEGMVEWCRQHIRDPRFRFDFFELESLYTAWDQKQGVIDTKSFVFPYPDHSFDSAILASVFTHMPPDDVTQYLRELARVMRPSGKVMTSIFFSPAALEIRDINVFHEPQRFLSDLAALPFDVTLTDPAELNPSFNCIHHWYLF